MPDDVKDTKTPVIGDSTDPKELANGETGYANARTISADEYFQRMRHTPVRACRWPVKDWQDQLEELGKDPIRHAERRFVSLVNEDHGELAGASPGIFIGIQLIHPGEVVPHHRHNSVAIYHYLQGTGVTTRRRCWLSVRKRRHNCMPRLGLSRARGDGRRGHDHVCLPGHARYGSQTDLVF